MTNNHQLRSVQVTRYVTPLREGGSLPAIAEADDGFLYVVKFRGAGQGARALIADLAGAELARVAGLKVPELVLAELDEAFGRTEGDEEIQDLLRASEGLNLGVHYLTGAISYDPAVDSTTARLASQIVWLDAFLMNVDRTARNTNMLTWNKELWLIDHGASLYFHHTWDDWEVQAIKPFVLIKDHVLLPLASELEAADQKMRGLLTNEKIREVLNLIPGSWLEHSSSTGTTDENREVYFEFLTNRIKQSSIFVNEALHARQSLI